MNLYYILPILHKYLYYSDPTLMGVTIANNTANNDGGGMYLYSSHPILTNSIIWGNSPESIYFYINSESEALITYSDIEGGWESGYCLPNNDECGTLNEAECHEWSNHCLPNNDVCGALNETECLELTNYDICEGWNNIDICEGWVEYNINSYPLFTDPENGDYTLQEDSPCIDAGTADTDGDGYEDITDYCGSAPDMGAYEYITEDCAECGAALGDVNGDSEINILDLVQIVNYILGSDVPPYACAADFNGDGEVNILDLVQIVNYILEN